jgi:hypothetical protein
MFLYRSAVLILAKLSRSSFDLHSCQLLTMALDSNRNVAVSCCTLGFLSTTSIWTIY